MSDAFTNVDFLRLAAVSDRNDRRQALDEEVADMFEQWRPALLKYLSTFGLESHDAEEVVQEVFLALFSHLRRDKARTNLRGWLFRVAHNLGLKRRHSGKKTIGLAAEIDSLPHPALNPEEELAYNQRHHHLSSILDALPEQDRRCLYLRAEGLRYREIAQILELSLGSVAGSLERSLAKFERAERRSSYVATNAPSIR